ncbi:TPA: hypothetical protein ACGRWA_001793 [Pseudomonas aeruginosa]
MRCVHVLRVLLPAVLLTACGESSDQQRAEDLAVTLAADPLQLKALRAQCAAQPQQVMGEEACRAAADAFRQRFFAGHTGRDEYSSLADLPPIPASFDTPSDDLPEGDATPASAEDTP